MKPRSFQVPVDRPVFLLRTGCYFYPTSVFSLTRSQIFIHSGHWFLNFFYWLYVTLSPFFLSFSFIFAFVLWELFCDQIYQSFSKQSRFLSPYYCVIQIANYLQFSNRLKSVFPCWFFHINQSTSFRVWEGLGIWILSLSTDGLLYRHPFFNNSILYFA